MAAKNRDASATPPSEGFPFFHRRYQGHIADAGRNDSREVLVRAAAPHSRPNAIHGSAPSSSSSFSASQKMRVSSRAARLVSQTQRVHQYITVGKSAHAHAVHTATLSLKHFRAMRKIGMQVSAEKTLLMLSKIRADAWV